MVRMGKCEPFTTFQIIMQKKGLKEDLVRWLANQNIWIPKPTILNMTWKYPDGRVYMQNTVDRALRFAEEESRIAVKDYGVTIQYKFIPPLMRIKYIPWSTRTDKTILFYE